MALFVSLDPNSNPLVVEGDLFTIVGGDGGLGEGAGVAGFSVQITYAQSNATIPSNRINALVNTAFALPILVAGLPSTGTLPDGTSIAGNGATGIINGTDSNGNVIQIIAVFYDVGQCNGTGIAVVGVGGGTLQSPNAVVLYHELSHAFHFATSTHNPDAALEEQAAETDENDLRAQLGLPLRDVLNHTGSCGGGVGPDCFIATAAYGTEAEDRRQHLRQIRDATLRGPRLGHDLFAALYREYYTFSMIAAADIRRWPAFRRACRLLLVDPLTEFYMYVVAAAPSGFDPELSRAAAEKVRRTISACIDDRRVSSEEVHTLALALGALADRRSGTPEPLPRAIDDVLADADPHGPVLVQDTVDYFTRLLGSYQSSLPLVRWAIVRPLARLWEIAAPRDGNASGDFAAALTNLAREWLGAAPLRYAGRVTEAQADADLRAFAATVYVDRIARQRVGQQILQYKPEGDFDMRRLLIHHGYLPVTVPEHEIHV